MKKTLWLFAFVLLSAGFASAQWSRTYGTSEWDSANSFQQTSDGGYILAGNTVSAGEFDFWAVKLDATGNIQWQKRYGGGGNEPAGSVLQTSDGGYVLAGSTDSFGAGGIDAWILRLDPSGNVQWQKTYGGSGTDWLNSIRETTDGGFVAAGGTDSFGAGMEDLWILKLSFSGSIQWQRSIGGSASDFANSVYPASDGGYVLAGLTHSFGPAGTNALVVKLDASGTVIQWQKTYGAAGSDFLSSIQQTSDSGYIICGGTSSSGAGNMDFWVLKLSNTGSIQWQKTYGGAGYETANSAKQTSDGGYIVSGGTYSFGAGDFDGWILKLNGSGAIQWQKTYGATAEDSLRVEPAADGGYLAAGSTLSFGAGSYDAWFVKLMPDGGIDPSCTLASDTLVVPANAIASEANSAASSVGTVSTIQDTSVTPAATLAVAAEQCAPPCLFCDDFEDGALASDWTYVKPSWSESGGSLTATPVKKAVAIASPAFSGCGNCSFEAGMSTTGGTGNRVWMLVWYADKDNTLEVLMKEENDKFVVKQRAGGSIVAKTKGLMPLLPNTSYNVKVTFDGANFTLLVNGNTLATFAAGTAPPTGTIGFQAKNTTARIGHVWIE